MASEILDRILGDIKEAMKARDRDRLLALRFLHSEIKNVGINERRDPTDEDVAAVIVKAIKQRQDVIEQSRAGGREDVVAREEFQIEVYKAYQPEQLGEAELESIVEEVIRETGAAGKKDMGRVMKVLMPRVKGRADGKLVSSVVSRKLG